ncbi:MAG TPA: DUF3300 domain-containing protein [Acidobacteriota bacterium]|nr:DUF3300 domain-containing protein [Acidobacteriota bacterium]
MIKTYFDFNTSAPMRIILSVSLLFCMLNVPPSDATTYIAGRTASMPAQFQDQSYVSYSPQQLDNLVAPIALYPDPLLAQVLPASTFPDQIDEAARYARANGSYGVDDQYWDVSVKAVAHYPSVLFMMSDKLDWTTALGQAYVYQSTDVMMAVQRLRGMAHSQGNLISTPQQEVIVQGGYITIVPAQPRYVFVPVYDPAVVYVRRASFGGVFGGVISFGAGFVIGAWLNRDCDWRDHRVFYHGWHGAGWIGRSRPVVQITNVYVNNRYTNININRTVINRNVNYVGINRYNTVHRDVTFDNHGNGKAHGNQGYKVNNKIINRNINTSDPVLERHRGHESPGRNVAPPVTPAPQAPRPNPQFSNRPAQPSPASHGLGRGSGGFDPRASSQRGQASRAESSRSHEAPGQSKGNKSESKQQEKGRKRQ